MRLLIPLFSPPTGTFGSLTRVLAIADAARRRGHEVSFTASGPLGAALVRRGYDVHPCPASTMFGLPRWLSDRIVAQSQRASLPVKPGRSLGSIWLVLLSSGVASYGHLRALVEAELAAVEAFRPDVLFTELEPAALIVARVTGLPIVSTYASVMQEGIGSFAYRRVSRAVEKVLALHGRPAMAADELCFSPEVRKVVPSVPELEDIAADCADLLFVGSLLAPIAEGAADDFDLAPSDRCVFVYLGTGSVALPAAERVLPEVFPAGCGVRCLVAAQSIEESRTSGAVELRSFVPSHRVLPQCDFTLCHGGHNSIIQSISEGVPLLIFPGPIFERRFNARKAVEAGCALMGELPDFRTDWLRTALGRRAELAAATDRLAARIRCFGGAQAALDAIEQLAHGQWPSTSATETARSWRPPVRGSGLPAQ